MGKIRVSTLGTQDEKAQKEKAKVRREEKKKRRIVDMSLAEPEIPQSPELALHPKGVTIEETPKEEIKESGKKSSRVKERSEKYLALKKLIQPGKLYSLSEALLLLKKTSLTRFDGSVETNINTTEKGLRGQVNFPHGTGRQVRVAIADDKLLEAINSGKIDFDILVASPAMMPKLAKVAKILGPKGLMPNPKSGTISTEPEKLASKLTTGQVQFKTETEVPIIHLVIGKLSFSEKDLEENMTSLLEAIGKDKIVSVFLKSTMSPSIKVQVS